MGLATYPTPKTLEENANLAETLEDLVEKHANDIPTLAKGYTITSLRQQSRLIDPSAAFKNAPNT